MKKQVKVYVLKFSHLALIVVGVALATYGSIFSTDGVRYGYGVVVELHGFRVEVIGVALCLCGWCIFMLGCVNANKFRKRSVIVDEQEKQKVITIKKEG